MRTARLCFIVLVVGICLVPPWRGPTVHAEGISVTAPSRFAPIWSGGGSLAMDLIFVEVGVAAALTFGVAWVKRAS